MAHDYLPPEVQALMGKRSEPRPCPVACERALIDHWVEALEDANPVYDDEQIARANGFENVVAPPGMLRVWSQPFRWTRKNGKTNLEDTALHFQVKKLMHLPVGIVSKTEVEYYKPLYVGDQVYLSESLIDVSPEKMTKLGKGHFWTVEIVYTNQKREEVGKQRLYGFAYKP